MSGDQQRGATAGTLPIEGLEAVYDRLAEAIDRAGPEKAELFLVKLALLNANALGDATRVAAHIDAALRDL
ncbi:MAG: DUF2783 domain-containing protein [Burkholderiales bacterium]|nr:DUF2783 domain-containing protein [Burkholderiales bacterium]